MKNFAEDSPPLLKLFLFPTIVYHVYLVAQPVNHTKKNI